MAGIASWLNGLFAHRETAGAEYKMADVYRGLRQQVLTLYPGSVGLSPSDSNRVWGLLMETGQTQAVSTLVAIGDGTVSLYFSNGGGIIGVGQHEGPRKSCEAFLAAAPSFLQYAEPVNDYPLPKKSHVRFYFLTYDGVFTVEAAENDLGYNRHPLSPLFHKAHEVIAQALLVDEGLRGQDNSAPGGQSQA